MSHSPSPSPFAERILTLVVRDADQRESIYTKYVVVDESTLRYRTYPASRPRQRSLLNGDIIKLFKDLRVTDSFLMKSKVREMLFRKPPAR